jgi:hypothetical protein
VKMPPDSTLPTIANINRKKARMYSHIHFRITPLTCPQTDPGRWDPCPSPQTHTPRSPITG